MNRLIETILFRTHNICFVLRKIILITHSYLEVCLPLYTLIPFSEACVALLTVSACNHVLVYRQVCFIDSRLSQGDCLDTIINNIQF